MDGDKLPELQPPRDAVFSAEFARLMGVTRATLKHYTSQARKGWPQGRGRPGFPLPHGRWLIEVPAKTPQQPVRRQWAPWWDRGEVNEFLAIPVAPGRQGQRREDPGEPA